MTIVEILIKARALIESEDNWYGGLKKFTGGGYCAHTALVAVPEVSQEQLGAAITVLLSAIGADCRTCTAIWNWNDNKIRTHAEVMAAYDRAIALAGEQKAA